MTTMCHKDYIMLSDFSPTASIILMNFEANCIYVLIIEKYMNILICMGFNNSSKLALFSYSMFMHNNGLHEFEILRQVLSMSSNIQIFQLKKWLRELIK